MANRKKSTREKVLSALAAGPRPKTGFSHIAAKDGQAALDSTLAELIAEGRVAPPRGYALRATQKEITLIVPCPKCGRKGGECVDPDGLPYSSYFHQSRRKLAGLIMRLLP